MCTSSKRIYGVHRQHQMPSSPCTCFVHVDQVPYLVLVILLTNTSLHSWSLSNSINPFQQMWEWFHLFLCESSPLPTFDPWPSLHIGNGVFTLAKPSEVFSLLAGVFTREVNLKNTVHTKSLVLESRDSI